MIARPPELFSEELATIQGWMIDVDGCLMRTEQAGGIDGEAMPSAGAFIEALYATGHSVVVCTNASERTPHDYAEDLRAAGIPIRDADFITAGSAAADHIAHHHPGDSVLAIGAAGLIEPLREKGLNLVESRAESVDVVVVGDAEEYSRDTINSACLAVEAGASLYTTVLTPWFYGGRGKSVVSSAMIAVAINWVTSRDPQILGKPSESLAQVIRRRLNVSAERICIVGDAPAEIKLARYIGAHSTVVLSGAIQAEDLDGLHGIEHPDSVAADIESLFRHLSPSFVVD
jgi:HAD superfamily hydrolase (TIGR01450 family)